MLVNSIWHLAISGNHYQFVTRENAVRTVLNRFLDCGIVKTVIFKYELCQKLVQKIGKMANITNLKRGTEYWVFGTAHFHSKKKLDTYVKLF